MFLSRDGDYGWCGLPLSLPFFPFLSQNLQVEKPDKDEHEKKLNELNAQFEKLKKDKDAVQKKIEATMTSGKNTEMGKARDTMQALRQKKGKLIDEKKAIRAELDVLKKVGDKLVNEKKDAKSSVKFGSIEEIDREIKKLQKLHSKPGFRYTLNFGS